MAEYIPPAEEFGRPGHLPNAAAVLVDLHRLLSIFLASRSYADLVPFADDAEAALHHPLVKLQEVEEDEIKRNLLTVAITARVLDDGVGFADDARSCGRFWRDIANGEPPVPLTLREACNKIIHASRIRFDTADNGRGRSYLNPILHIYGLDLREREYKAELQLIEFARSYTECVQAHLL